MAYITGTASNFAGFYNTLRDFLTSDAALVALGQEWTQISGPTGSLTAADKVVFQAPGLSGTDEILVGIEGNESVSSDYYNLLFSGFTAWNPAIDYRSQVGATHDYTLPLWDQPMTYWLVANGRRAAGVVKVGIRYLSFYVGHILPYVLPSAWPYPLFIAANSRSPTVRYSATTPNMRGFFDPGETNASLCFPDGIWRGVVNRYDNNGSDALRSDRNIEPYRFDDAPLRDNWDGSYNLEQVRLVCSDPFAAQLGALQGVFRCSGFDQGAENIVTHSGVQHLLFPNVYRVTWRDYCALALE